jgi:hypothetical protein
MKLSFWTLLGMVVIGTVLLAMLGLLIFVNSGSTKSAAVTDENHCPVCGRELPPGYVGTGKCPYCEGRQARGEKLANLPSRPLTSRLLTVSVLLTLAFLGLLTTHVILFVRARAARKVAEETFYYQCPKCARKIRYRDCQIGHVAQCPLCRRPIVFPRPEGWEPPVSLWVKMKRRLGLARRVDAIS